MVNVAILNAIKNSRKIAINNDFEFALDRIRMGIYEEIIIFRCWENKFIC